ncbi:MAG: alpha/beta hydrolase [Pseudomonadota bacterium]
MAPELKTLAVNGVELAYVERGAPRPDRPTLLFVHATGFHAHLWDYHAEALADVHTIALDQRGHGRSTKRAVQHWSTFGEDQVQFVRALGLERLIGIGHSMGAHAMIDGAAHSGAFSRLLLLDPTVVSPEDYAHAEPNPFGEGLHPAAKRRRYFDSPQDMIERLRPKSSFPLFDERILSDYCRFGLEPDADHGWRLACDPEVEAAVYMSARTNGAVYDSVRSLDIPVTVVRAQTPEPGDERNFSMSPTWPSLAGAFPQARDLHWADCSHFIPMERPDAVLTLIREEIDAWQDT